MLKFLTSLITILIILCGFPTVSHAQSWDVVFRKAEKHYEKGHYKKVQKVTRKLRKKQIEKKYNNDSALYALSYVMEAKGFEALADYPAMQSSIKQATDGLRLVEERQPAHYITGILRLADVYFTYGNFKKADSLVNIAAALPPDRVPDEQAALEIQLRIAQNELALGNYRKALTLTDTLITQWPLLPPAITTPDKEYRNQILARLYTLNAEIYRAKGEYAQAKTILDRYDRQVTKLVSSQSTTYANFHLCEIAMYMDWGDTKEARKLSTRLLGKHVPGRLYAKAAAFNMTAMSELGKTEDAAMILKKTQKALRKTKVKRIYINAYKDLYAALIKSYEVDIDKNIIKRFNHASEKALADLPADHSLITDNCNLALDYIYETQRTQNLPFAESFFLSLGTSLSKRYPDPAMAISIYKVNFAGYYMKYSETPAKAFSLLARAPYKKPLEELSTIHPDYARMVDDLMEYFALTGNFDYPIQLMKSIILAMNDSPNTDKEDLGAKMTDLARLQVLGGYYKEAETNTDEALKLIRRGGERKSEEYVQALNNAALLYGTIGLYGKAEKLLGKAESIYKKLETVNLELRLESVVDLAFLYTRMGEYSETESLLEDVIKKRTKVYGAKSRRLIKPYQALGEMYRIRGEYPLAEKNLRKALALTSSAYGDTTLLFAENLSLLVKLYIDLGNYEAALINASDVLKIREKALREQHILFADTYTDLGHIYDQLGSHPELVSQYYSLARDIIETNFSKTHPLYAEALKNMAYVDIQQGSYDDALQLLNQADEIWLETLDNLNKSSGEVARLKGDIYSFQGKSREARREYEKSAKYFRKIFSEKHPDYLNTESRLARAYFIDDELKSVESTLSMTTAAYLEYTKTYFPTLSEEEKAKFWNKIKPDFEFYNTVAVQYSTEKPKYLENMYDFALATKGLLLSNAVRTRNSIMNSGDTVMIGLFKEWIAKKEFLTTTLAKSPDELADNDVNVAQLKDEIAQLEKQLSLMSADFQTSFEYRLYSWDDVRKALKADEAAVEIIRYREFDTRFNEEKVRYAALIITADTRKYPELVLFENGNEMEDKSFKYQRNSTKYQMADTRSFATYWAPIYDRIKDKKVIYLSPDGIYNQINIESLLINDTTYVIDKMNVRVLNNTKTIAALRSKEGRKSEKDRMASASHTALLVGNPLYYNIESNKELAKEESQKSGSNVYVPQLPGTEAEVKNITGLLEQKGWKIEYYLGTSATEEQIKSAQNYTLVHIATHGFFDDKSSNSGQILLEEDDNPLERSGLLAEGGGDVLVKATKNYNIEDGILTAHEAMNLNFEKTELIVLSACETGRGEIQQGEGVFGLQRSFLVAGADAIIMSLFQVSDEVTQELMAEFYNNWMNGQDKRTAFHNAQLSIRSTHPQPIYWGAFTMIARI